MPSITLIDYNSSHRLENISREATQEFILPEAHIFTWWIANMLGSVIGSVGTFVVLTVLFTARRLRSKTNTLITSLMVSDFLISVILQPARANYYNMYFVIDMYDSSFIFIVSALCYLSTLGNILAVSLERFFAVVFPFKYSSLVTKKAVRISLLVVWLSSATVSIVLHRLKSPENLDRRVFDIFAIVTFSFVLTALIFIYGFIFRIVAIQKRKLSRQLSHVVRWYNDKLEMDVVAVEEIKYNIKNEKPTMIVTMLAMTFVFLWLPIWIFIIMKEILWSDRLQDVDIIIPEQYLVSIHLWISSINWYIYCWKCAEFRKEFDLLIRKIKAFFGDKKRGILWNGKG